MALVTSLLIAASLAAVNAETFSGDGTAYTLGAPMDGNCNMMYAPKAASANYAALNNEQWDDMANCGRCAKVWSPDTPDNSALVYILDRCPECAHGDLDLSPTVFKKITGSGPSRLPIQWEFADCPVESNIQLCLKSGSNPYYMAVQPTNVAVGVKDMKINDAPCSSMVDSAYYFLAESQGDLNSVKVQLTSVNGDSVEDTVSMQAGKCVETNSQFKINGGGNGGADFESPAGSTGNDATPAPTDAPTEAPTEAPTNAPTEAPTAAPTEAPTEAPTDAPATDSPAPESPATDAPATDSPAPESPATDTPATDAPATDAPATDPPAAETPMTTSPPHVIDCDPQFPGGDASKDASTTPAVTTVTPAPDKTPAPADATSESTPTSTDGMPPAPESTPAPTDAGASAPEDTLTPADATPSTPESTPASTDGTADSTSASSDAAPTPDVTPASTPASTGGSVETLSLEGSDSVEVTPATTNDVVVPSADGNADDSQATSESAEGAGTVGVDDYAVGDDALSNMENGAITRTNDVSTKTSGEASDSSLGGGAIAGMIGAAAVVAAVVGAIVVHQVKSKRNLEEEEDAEGGERTPIGDAESIMAIQRPHTSSVVL